MFNPYCQKPSCTGNPNGTSVIHFIRFIGSLGCHSEEVVVETFRFPSPSFNLTMMSVHLCLCIRVYVYVYMYVYICMCMYMCIVCTCICNCKCVCMSVCMYVRMAVWFYGMYPKKPIFWICIDKGVRYSLVVLLALPKREGPGSIPNVALARQAGSYFKTLQLGVTS